MSISARYVHTNVVAHDWKRLAAFYEQVFGCVPVPPERHAVGPWVEACTRVPNAEVRGMHLRLPGYEGHGPTLEVFQYNREEPRQATALNRPGFAHIAFTVDDVEAARDAVLAAGGGLAGELVTVEVAGAGRITLVYATDPEGNVIELQKWST